MGFDSSSDIGLVFHKFYQVGLNLLTHFYCAIKLRTFFLSLIFSIEVIKKPYFR